MAIYNTCVSVVANLEAASASEAIAALHAALRRAGFDVYESACDDAFESEEGTEISTLPAVPRGGE